MSFIFSLNFSIILIFRHIKPILKDSFLKFCLLEIIVRPYISLMTKLEVYNLLAPKLENSKMAYNSVEAFSVSKVLNQDNSLLILSSLFISFHSWVLIHPSPLINTIY